MLLRVLPLLIALALLLAPSSQAAVFVAASPASSPIAATPENACTAFFEEGSESRIGLLCHNDPVNRTDPDGLVERIQADSTWEMAKGTFGNMVAQAMSASATVTGQSSQRTSNPDPAGRGSRTPNASDYPLRMIPQPQLTRGGKYNKVAYHQLASRDNTPLDDRDLRFQEVTKQDSGNAFRIKTSDGYPAKPLIRGGLFRDSIGFGNSPDSKVPPGNAILYQKFRAEDRFGNQGPPISTQLRHQTQLDANRNVTIQISVIDD